MTETAHLTLAVDSRPVVSAKEHLEEIAAAAKKAEDAASGFGKRAEDAGKRAEAANDNLAQSAQKADGVYNRLIETIKRFGAGLLAAFGVRALSRIADGWSDMQSRVGAAVKDMEAAPELMQRMVDIANASYSPLAQTVEIYSRNVAVLADLGGSAKDAADFTESLNHMLVLTATRGERAASVQNALSKAMAVGKLQAENLETILANGGRVAEALAEELGTTVSGLRKLASEGKITGDIIATAITKRLSEVREAAAEMPATIEDAFVRFGTNFTAMIGQMDKTIGISERVAAAIIFVADNLEEIAKAAALAGGAMALAFGPQLVAMLSSATTAFGVLAAAMLANPFGIVAAAVAAIVVALIAFKDETIEVGSTTVNVGKILNAVWTTVTGALKLVIGHIGTVAEVLHKLVTGDFSGAWQAVKNYGDQMVNTAEDVVDAWRKVTEQIGYGIEFPDDPTQTATKFKLPGGAGDTATKLNEYQQLTKAINDNIASMQLEAETIGMTQGAAERLTMAHDLEKAAIEAKLEITPALRAEIDALSESYANAALGMEGARLGLELMNDPLSQLGREIAQLDELLAAGAISWDQYGDAAMRANMNAASSVLGLAGDLTGALGKMFGESKAWAIAQAVINTAQAITRTIAQYGATPWGLAAAAVAAATGAAQIATIASTNKGGGASRPSAPSAAGVGRNQPQEAPQQAPQQAVHITIQGENFSRQAVMDLMDQMSDIAGDGHKLIIKAA